MAPYNEACARCGERDLVRGAVLDAHGGGVSCASCAASLRGQGARPLSAEVRAMLALAAAQPSLEKAALYASENALDPETERAAGQAMTAILSRYIARPLRSLEFIAKMIAASG